MLSSSTALILSFFYSLRFCFSHDIGKRSRFSDLLNRYLDYFWADLEFYWFADLVYVLFRMNLSSTLVAGSNRTTFVDVLFTLVGRLSLVLSLLALLLLLFCPTSSVGNKGPSRQSLSLSHYCGKANYNGGGGGSRYLEAAINE